MPAERRDFGAPLEELIYCDTAFAVAALSRDEPFHAESRLFFDRFGVEHSVAVFSDFVLDELAFWVLKGNLAAEARRTGQRWIDVKRQHPDLVRQTFPEIEAKRGELDAQCLKLLILDSVTDRAFQLMHDFALLPADAYHIATALESGVNAFVTLDRDFLDVDGIIVYTCLPDTSFARS